MPSLNAICSRRAPERESENASVRGRNLSARGIPSVPLPVSAGGLGARPERSVLRPLTRILLVCAVSLGFGSRAPAASPATEFRAYTGCCDGSAAAPVNAALFASASDEENVLRLYSRDTGGPAVATLNLRSFLGPAHRAEADIEGGARLGEMIFWVGSHSRNTDGEARPARHVLFATAIRGEGHAARLEPVGQPYRGLATALAADPRLARFRFLGATQVAGEAPGGLNIEGLAAGPGDSLYLGLRNPLSLGRAILVPVLNPREIVQANQTARLGEALVLDLDGLGIRDIARAGDRYLILAGPAEKGGRHRLFVWGGDRRDPVLVSHGVPKGFQAEGLVVDDVKGQTSADLLGDEDDVRIGGTECQNLKDTTLRRFRALRVRF